MHDGRLEDQQAGVLYADGKPLLQVEVSQEAFDQAVARQGRFCDEPFVESWRATVKKDGSITIQTPPYE
jgi:hypothetical protein